MCVNIVLEEALCDEAMAQLEAAGADVTIDATLANLATADAVILSGEAAVPDALYAPDAAVRVVGLLGQENENFTRARATRAGLVVLKPRSGEAASVADDALYLMLSMARERKTGGALELKGKALGFLGFPPVAGEIAQRAQGFGMTMLCYDPELNRGRAMLYHCESTSLVDLFVRSDFVVLTQPLSDWSTALVGKDEIQLMQKGAGLICLTDPRIFRWEELVRALDWGYLEYFAIDLPQAQAHLAKDVAPYGKVTVAEAANTREARLGNQIEMAKDVVAALSGEQVNTAVNMPQVHQANLKEGKRWCTLGHLLGVFMGQRLQALPKALVIEEQGALPVTESDAIVAYVLAGLAEGLGEEKINVVNSRLWAEEKGLQLDIAQARSALKSQLKLSMETPHAHLQVAGEHASGEDNIVQVDDYHLQGHPHEHLLLVPHINRPGLIGQVGSLLGEKDVNIAEMMLGYKPQDHTTALMWMQIEQPLDRSISEESRKLASVLNMEYIHLPIVEESFV